MARFKITNQSQQLAKSKGYFVKEVMDTKTDDTYSLFLEPDGKTAKTVKDYNRFGDKPNVVEMQYTRVD
ncbi:MAG: hypothetical protein F6K50_02630 [Moorea sp. SIO3I7]|nr:hypothetical protein [Moorena sp. SIO3I7]